MTGGYPATVSVDGIIFDLSIFVVLKGVAFLLFLFGAIRMQQARRAAHWVRMGMGFAMLLGSVVYEVTEMTALLEVNYWPGMGKEQSGYAYDLPEIQWWEPWAWWGNWVLHLAGSGLVVMGFFGAAREMIRERVFDGCAKGKGGAR